METKSLPGSTTTTLTEGQRGVGDGNMKKKKRPRVSYMDVVRSFSVFCVVYAHSWQNLCNPNIPWTKHMMYQATQWILPLLFSVTGSSFYFSRMSYIPFLIRLLLYTALCLAGNVFVIIASNSVGIYKEWGFESIVYQSWYLIYVIFFQTMCWPLKKKRSLFWKVFYLILAPSMLVIVSCIGSLASPPPTIFGFIFPVLGNLGILMTLFAAFLFPKEFGPFSPYVIIFFDGLGYYPSVTTKFMLYIRYFTYFSFGWCVMAYRPIFAIQQWQYIVSFMIAISIVLLPPSREEWYIVYPVVYDSLERIVYYANTVLIMICVYAVGITMNEEVIPPKCVTKGMLYAYIVHPVFIGVIAISWRSSHEGVVAMWVCIFTVIISCCSFAYFKDPMIRYTLLLLRPILDPLAVKLNPYIVKVKGKLKEYLKPLIDLLDGVKLSILSSIGEKSRTNLPTATMDEVTADGDLSEEEMDEMLDTDDEFL